MIKKILPLVFIFSVGTFSACKSFLDITPIDKLTGNNFYKSLLDVEYATNDLYGAFFRKYEQTAFAAATGEFRSGECIGAPQETGRQSPAVFGRNDLNLIVRRDQPWDGYRFDLITYWDEYYRIIQSANLLIAKINEGVPGMSDADNKRYIAESKFMRCLAYFFMVRLYGDVPYYTDAYQKDPLPREKMVTVMNNCIADLTPSINDVPWQYQDPALKGVRASRGAIMVLLMHMNMWNSAFDPANKTKYCQEAANYGDQIVKSNAYQLLPIEQWNLVVRGRSNESLFEFFNTINYEGSTRSDNAYAPFGDAFIHFPYKQPEFTHRYSFTVFKREYMQRLYPESEPDMRKQAWFVAQYDQDHTTFQLLKFAANTFIGSGNPDEDRNPDNAFLIFRYGDAILLRAEALAELGGASEQEAVRMLNMIRDRAKATPYSGGSSQTLKDAIFLERSKELLGEGHRYFDLVRTGRILSNQWTDNPLTQDQFNRGGWTWPLNSSALNNNPLISLNTYWVSQ
ncbi:MAG: RagB/SusD family nutrient uptake outer membrane protein [Mucilaginibacter polytrichastri]|nr:RagB/SusD family nutrient uptake outer membrane protein [Mucilaginibacter polytrichastri]